MLQDDPLAQVLSETGFLIPSEQYHFWRATERASGVISGIDLPLTILATNGSLGLFQVKDRPGYFLGHIEHFSEKVITFGTKDKLKPTPKPKTPKLKGKWRELDEI